MPPARLAIAGGEEPALDLELVTLPVQVLRLAPVRTRPWVAVRDGPPSARRTGPDLRWLAEGLADQGQRSLVAGGRDAQGRRAPRGGDPLGACPETRDAAVPAHPGQAAAAVAVFGEQDRGRRRVP